MRSIPVCLAYSAKALRINRKFEGSVVEDIVLGGALEQCSSSEGMVRSVVSSS